MHFKLSYINTVTSNISQTKTLELRSYYYNKAFVTTVEITFLLLWIMFSFSLVPI